MSKYRVHELAKELKMSSKDLIKLIELMDIETKSHMSLLTEEESDRIIEEYGAVSIPIPDSKIKALNVDEDNVRPKPIKPLVKKPEFSEKKSDFVEKKSDNFTKRPEQVKKPQFGEKKNDNEIKKTQTTTSAEAAKAPEAAEKAKQIRPAQNRVQQTKKPGDNNRNGYYSPQKKKGYNANKSKANQADKVARKTRHERELELEEASDTIMITVPITVQGFAEQIDRSSTEIIMKLMHLGIMATVNQNIDEDAVLLLIEEFGVDAVIGKVEEDVVELGIETDEDALEDLKPRAPIIAVMGHVDHGKTSLLDAIRNTNITASESGGITQHIGASEIYLGNRKIVCLDTPGHEAFTAMRARGAQITDIAILVVAADDSVKPQTIEAISHAKAAGVPIIVAINKIDKPSANIEKVKQDLTQHGVLIEDFGGDVICVPVSAKSGEGIDTLLEMVLLEADILELKANPLSQAKGTVVEARLDKAKGPVATIIVQKGTLSIGNPIVAGVCSGKIRAMQNWKGESIKKAGPSTAVEIIGLSDVPEAGDEMYAVREEKMAKTIANNRTVKLREETMQIKSHVTLEDLFSQIQKGHLKELNIIIKADVQGSVGAVSQSLEKLAVDDITVKIVYSGVGAITESDIMLASASNAIIIGFNVRPSANIIGIADREKVQIQTYRIIYEAINDIEAALKGMLDPEYREVVLGRIEIRATFKVPGAGTIGGAYVLDGKVQRNAEIRLLRDGIVIHEGKISSLKRFKDDAKEVATGYECGIGIENYNDIKEGDIVEAFKMVEVERK